MESEILFYLLAGVSVYGALVTVLHRDLVVCALHLAGTMLGISGLFFILGAHFIAWVQVLVYAGAVMVFFIMVVMLFDQKKREKKWISLGIWPKVSVLFFFGGLVAGLFPLSLHLFHPIALRNVSVSSTKDLASILFSKYVFVFEVLGILLLVIAIGVTALCRGPYKQT